jgi:uncharacterized protein (TIGR01777 family)
MKIFMTGGTGFVGTTLTRKLVDQGHHVTVLTRKIKKDQINVKGVSFIEGDPTREGEWQKQAVDHEAFINLAGSSIFRRWNHKAKALMRDSRVLTTKNLVEALKGREGKETILISTSAVGYYGFHDDEELDENSAPGEDFLASLSKDWEAAAMQAEHYGVRVLICRLGIVLGAKGGALGEMIPIFKKGLGSPIGSGEQWFSWIYEQDLVEIYLFLLGRKDLSGPVNCTAPEPVKNKAFTKALGKALGRPAFMPSVPAFVIKLMKGEFGTVLLKGQRVFPKRLSEAGFHFRFPQIRDALQDLLR